MSVGKSLGLEIDNDDVEELLDEHQAELTTEELLRLQNEQKKMLEEEMSSEEEEARKDAPTSEIKQMCSKWTELQNLVELHHPDKAAATRVINDLNDTIMNHFRKVLKRRQKQVSLDRYFKRKEHPVAELSVAKRFERESTPQTEELPEVLMEGDPPSKQ